VGRMNVMTEAGDITVTWDPEDPVKVEQAKSEWDRLKKDGYEFFVPGEPKAKRVKRWDPSRAHVIAAPGVQSPAERKDPAHPRSRAMAGGPNAESVTFYPAMDADACVLAALREKDRVRAEVLRGLIR
jgi:hypothetical protein